ncbi:MAG: hypothetical protein HZB25_09480 [Candidatus Eisenbacteria bacterium]|nr:hypothetical protein [Candidatus Eisenbacteria bacterium]
MNRSHALASLAVALVFAGSGTPVSSTAASEPAPLGPPRFLSSGARRVYEQVWAPARGIRVSAASETSDGSRPAVRRIPADPGPAWPLPRSIAAPASGLGTLSIPPFANLRVNNPTGDGTGETQSETAAAAFGSRVILGFNDSKGFTTGTISSSAYSSDGGQTWTDGGDLPLQGLGAGEQLYGDPGLCANRRGHWWFSSLYFQPGNISAIGVLRGTFAGAAPVWLPPVAVSPTVPDFQDKPMIGCDPDSDYVYVVYTRFINGAGEGRMEFSRSLDGGATWSPFTILQPLIPGDNVQGGWIVVDDLGAVHVFWEDGLGRPPGTGQHSFLLHRKSGDHGSSFAPTDTVATIRPNWYAGPPGFNRRDGFFEFPNAGVDLSAGPNRGTIYVTWNESVEPVFSGTPPAPHAEVEPNNVAAQADSVGLPLRISGNISTTTDLDYFKFQGTVGQMVRVSVTPDAALFPWVRLGGMPTGDTLLMEARYGTGAQTFGWVTLPSTGIYTVYLRSWNSTVGAYTLDLETVSAGAGSVARDHRDAVVAVSRDHGATWDAPVVLNDDAPYFDQCMPMIAVDSLGLAHVFWYDRRNDPQRGGRTDIYFARSSDGGASWSPNVRITDQASTWQVSSRAAPNFGDYSTAASSGNQIFPAWADGRFGTPDAFTAPVLSGFSLACPADTTVVRSDTLRANYTLTNLSAFAEVFRYTVGDSLGYFAPQTDSVSLAAQGSVSFSYVRVVPDTITINRDDPVLMTGTYRSAAFAPGVCRSVARLRWSLVAVGDAPAPETRLQRPWPSPARGGVRLGFSLARAGQVRISVFDVAGRLLARPVDGARPSGAHEVRWDGRGPGRGPVPAGVYFVRAELPGVTQVERFVLLH